MLTQTVFGVGAKGGVGGGGELPIMDYTGKLRQKKVSFTGWRYIKWQGFHEFEVWEMIGKTDITVFKRAF